jgi:C4-dicarboxylate transporter, DctQ subunit
VRSLLTLLARLHDGLTELGVQAAKLCIAAMLVLYCWEVFSRYLLGTGTWWSNEYVPYLVCAATFLMMPAITRNNGHVSMSVLENILPPRFALHGRALILVLSLVVCCVISWILLKENIRQVVQDISLLRVRQTPKVYVSVWITYGFVSSAFYLLRKLVAIRDSAVAPAAEVETL